MRYLVKFKSIIRPWLGYARYFYIKQKQRISNSFTYVSLLRRMSLLNFTRHSSVKAYSFEKGRAVNAQPCFPHSLSCKSCVPCYRPLCILRLTYENAHVNAFGKHLTICSHLSRILSNPSAQAMTISLSPLHAGSRASGLSALTETAATRKRLAISKNVSPSQAL